MNSFKGSFPGFSKIMSIYIKNNHKIVQLHLECKAS